MTRQVHSRIVCKCCGEPITCSNCGSSVSSFTPFSDWLRSLSYPYNSAVFDNQNLDYIWFNYREGWLITIEEKRYGAMPTDAQADTHNIIAQMLARASGGVYKTWRGWRNIEYRGHYLVVFEKTTPNDSNWIKINRRLCSKNDLLRLLGSGRLTNEEALCNSTTRT